MHAVLFWSMGTVLYVYGPFNSESLAKGFIRSQADPSRYTFHIMIRRSF